MPVAAPTPSTPRGHSPVGIDAAIARIRAFAAFKGWAKSRYAIEAGLAPNTLRDFDAADWSPTVDTLRALEALVPSDFDPRAHVAESAA